MRMMRAGLAGSATALPTQHARRASPRLEIGLAGPAEIGGGAGKAAMRSRFWTIARSDLGTNGFSGFGGESGDGLGRDGAAATAAACCRSASCTAANGEGRVRGVESSVTGSDATFVIEAGGSASAGATGTASEGFWWAGAFLASRWRLQPVNTSSNTPVEMNPRVIMGTLFKASRRPNWNSLELLTQSSETEWTSRFRQVEFSGSRTY